MNAVAKTALRVREKLLKSYRSERCFDDDLETLIKFCLPLQYTLAIYVATMETKYEWAPEAAAPQRTPQMRGIHVTGLVSCRRIFRISSVVEAPAVEMGSHDVESVMNDRHMSATAVRRGQE